MSDEIKSLEDKISDLRMSSERLLSEAYDHEDMVRAGQDDGRHIVRISDCYKQIAANSYEEGRLSAKLEFLQDRSNDQSNQIYDNKTEDRWVAREEQSKKDQDNWWRSSQADERPEPTPEDERDDARYRR